MEHLDTPLCGCEACQAVSELHWEETTQGAAAIADGGLELDLAAGE